MDQGVSTTVDCYSGMAYADRPRAFFWEGAEITVKTVLASLRTPDGKTFRVLGEDQQRYLLTYDEAGETWFVALIV